VIRILADALTNPAKLVERFGAAGILSDHIPKLLNRAVRLAAALGGSPDQRAKLVRELVEKGPSRPKAGRSAVSPEPRAACPTEARRRCFPPLASYIPPPPPPPSPPPCSGLIPLFSGE
jgi:hypothetical protein